MLLGLWRLLLAVIGFSYLELDHLRSLIMYYQRFPLIFHFGLLNLSSIHQGQNMLILVMDRAYLTQKVETLDSLEKSNLD